MKENLTELVFILDKSGSMSGLENDTIGGFNSLIEKQKKEQGEAIVTTVLFNSGISIIHDRKPISEITKLTEKDYFVGGCTALLDAVGQTINNIKHNQEALCENEKPNKTLFVITTDGMENSSKEYNYSKVKDLISKAKEKDNFEFIFLGANIDSAEEANKLGIDKDLAVNFNNDSEGIKLNYCALDKAIRDVRCGCKPTKGWRNDIDKDMKKRGKK